MLWLAICLCMFSSHLDFSFGLRVKSFLVVPGKRFDPLIGSPAHHTRKPATLPEDASENPAPETCSERLGLMWQCLSKIRGLIHKI